ncbi:MAG: WD40 repeat domain-containing protein [Bacteroidia bacterium]|jgi:WD40 repeat protein|nr:WD40 repeat domain-containing protein [Bacteroidia bacterium]
MITINKKKELLGHKAGIYAMCAEMEGIIYSGGVDKHVIRWDIQNDENSKIVIKSTEAIYSLYYYKDKNLMFIGTSSGKMHILDLFEKKEIKLLKSHTDKIFEFKVFASFILSVSADGHLGFTDLETLKTAYILKVSDQKIRSIDIKGNLAVIACGDSSIKVIDLSSRKELHSFVAHEKATNVVKFHPTENILLSGGWDAHLKLWDSNYELIKSIPAHNYAIYSLEFSPDKTLLASGSRDKSIKIWDVSSIEFPKSITYENLKGHQFSVNRLFWDELSGDLVSAGDDKKIMVWEIKNSKAPKSLGALVSD